MFTVRGKVYFDDNLFRVWEVVVAFIVNLRVCLTSLGSIPREKCLPEYQYQMFEWLRGGVT